MSNSAPVGPLVFLGDPNVGNTLIARPNGIVDADGINPATTTFQWLRNGDPILGATDQRYTLTSADQGAGISVSYSYLDLGGTQETVRSNSKMVLASLDAGGTFTPPAVTGIEPIPTPNNSAPQGPLSILGDALVGETLIARPNAIIDADGINDSTKKFQWLRDGDVIPGATSQSYIVTDADRGAQISVLYTYFDNGGSFEVVASKPEPIVPGGTTPPPPAVEEPPAEEEPVVEPPVTETPPTGFMNSVPIGKLIILGFPVEGADLWARTDAVFDRDGFNPANARFQWLRDGEPISGATSNTYRITEVDRGASLSVEMSFIDGAGTLETVVSEPEPPVPDPDAPETPTVPEDPQQPGASGVLEGTSGNDISLVATTGIGRIDGLDGIDRAIFSGDQTNYTLRFSRDAVTLTDRTEGGLGTIAIDNIELIDFGTDLPVFGDAVDLRQFGGHTALDQETFESFVEMYIAYFNRAPDAVGLAFWGTAYANGMSLEEIAAEFAAQPETLAVYPADTNNFSFTSSVYQNVLGRSPDIEGLRFWVDALNDGTVSRAGFILEVLRGVKQPLPQGTDQALIDRQLADQQYLEQKTDLGALFAVHRGMSNVDDAAQVMGLFDGSLDSLADAVDAIEVLYSAAMDTVNGDFLMPLVGVLDDPFGVV